MYPKLVTDGRYYRLVECPMGSQGTMGQWDIPMSPWTFYGKAGLLRDISSRVTISNFF